MWRKSKMKKRIVKMFIAFSLMAIVLAFFFVFNTCVVFAAEVEETANTGDAIEATNTLFNWLWFSFCCSNSFKYFKSCIKDKRFRDIPKSFNCWHCFCSICG